MNKTIISILLLLLPLYAMAETGTDSIDVARNSIFDPPQEEQVFFYHKDHLGSTLCITDRNGQIVERSEYIPYGEVFIDNVASDAEYETPYKFTGKEYDEETGLYYFGARYLHPKYATWLSVDPFAMKYPNVSPYEYCHDNPIKFIDPDGMDDYELAKDGKISLLRKTKEKSDVLYSGNNQISCARGFLSGLASTGYARTTSVTDAFNVFKFVSDNSKVEWSLKGIGNRKDYYFSLVTNNNEESVRANHSDDASNFIFILHNHPYNSNIKEGPKASGDYKAYLSSSEGSRTIGAEGDVWVLNDIYTVYKEAHPNRSISEYPKAYIYYNGDRKHAPQLFQYNLKSPRFKVYYNCTSSQMRNIIWGK